MSFVDFSFSNNLSSSTSNNINILDTININVKNDINCGIDTKIIKNNLNSKIYHIYKNHIISETNIAPIKHIIDNYIYFFRNNYLYYLDKLTNQIKLKKLIFKNVTNVLNENNFEIYSDDYAENIYYFNISISCIECNNIYVNETNNYIFLLLPEIEYIIVFDITNLAENYILIPPNKDYSECIVMNDKENILNIAYLYCKNDMSNTIDIYSINAETYLIDFIKSVTFVNKIIKNIITNYNIFSLCEDNILVINLNLNNIITNVYDILLNNYFIKDDNLQIILPYKITTFKIQDYNINYMKDLITCISDTNKPMFIITNE